MPTIRGRKCPCQEPLTEDEMLAAAGVSPVQADRVLDRKPKAPAAEVVRAEYAQRATLRVLETLAQREARLQVSGRK